MSSQPSTNRHARASRTLSLSDPLREVENHFWELFARPASALAAPKMKLDIAEDDKAYRIKADIPGVKKEDIKVKIEGNRVSIGAEIRKDQESKSGTRIITRERSGSQYRAFTLARDIDSDKAAANYQDGVLELTLPKKPGGSPKDVEVK